MNLRQRLQAQHNQRRDQHLWRSPQAWTQRAGQQLLAPSDAGVSTALINFAGNDYLGLAHHPQVVEACARAVREYGVGSGASRLVSGSHPEHLALEEELADWLQRPRALYFGAGYLLNLALVAALFQRGDRIVCDRLNHASLVDGARLGAAEIKRYPHADAVAAARQLAGAEAASAIVTDGVFSMDGDYAPLAELQELAQRNHSLFMVDDAHGLGVLGEHGRGSFEHLGLLPGSDTLLIGTCGKALGTSGAFVSGDALWIDHLQQYARSWIYTTAPPPAIAAATRAALRIVRAEPQRRRQLWDNIAYFRRALTQAGVPLSASESAIQPLIVGDNEQALALARQLQQRGLWVVAMREPTVPKGTARLRITLTADHRREQIEQLITALQDLWPQHAAAAMMEAPAATHTAGPLR